MSEFFEHYVEILSDPAHLAVELTLMLLVDILFLGMILPFMKRFLDHRIRREHQKLDDEHGVKNHGKSGE